MFTQDVAIYSSVDYVSAEDVRNVTKYVQAMRAGLDLSTDRWPVSGVMVRQLPESKCSRVRGDYEQSYTDTTKYIGIRIRSSDDAWANGTLAHELCHMCQAPDVLMTSHAGNNLPTAEEKEEAYWSSPAEVEARTIQSAFRLGLTSWTSRQLKIYEKGGMEALEKRLETEERWRLSDITDRIALGLWTPFLAPLISIATLF